MAINKDKLPRREEKAWWSSGLRLFGLMTAWIVAPIIGAIYLGHYLDERYGTEPWLFLSCVGVAFILSNVGIVREGLRALREIKEIDQKSEQK